MTLITQEPSAGLDRVRDLVNTWYVANDTRQAVEDLPRILQSASAWSGLFPFALNPNDKPAQIFKLRDDLRAAIESPETLGQHLNPWLQKNKISVSVEIKDGTPCIQKRSHSQSAVDAILLLVVNAIESGEWSRLKCCPDCRFCFLDTSKNRSKRWCGMSKGGPDGRACGTIAKVRNFRERNKKV